MSVNIKKIKELVEHYADKWAHLGRVDVAIHEIFYWNKAQAPDGGDKAYGYNNSVNLANSGANTSLNADSFACISGFCEAR